MRKLELETSLRKPTGKEIIYDFIKKNPNCTSEKIKKYTGLEARRTREILEHMRQSKIISFRPCECNHTYIYRVE